MRAVRVKARVSLRGLARRLKVSAAYLSDLELGRRRWNHRMREEYLSL